MATMEGKYSKSAKTFFEDAYRACRADRSTLSGLFQLDVTQQFKRAASQVCMAKYLHYTIHLLFNALVQGSMFPLRLYDYTKTMDGIQGPSLHLTGVRIVHSVVQDVPKMQISESDIDGLIIIPANPIQGMYDLLHLTIDRQVGNSCHVEPAARKVADGIHVHASQITYGVRHNYWFDFLAMAIKALREAGLRVTGLEVVTIVPHGMQKHFKVGAWRGISEQITTCYPWSTPGVTLYDLLPVMGLVPSGGVTYLPEESRQARALQ
jgi:hypothetical protein